LSDEVETQRDQWDWQTMKIRSAAIAFALLVDPAFANAMVSICEAIAMRTTTKTENLYALKQGQTIDAITQYNVDRKTGAASLCSHGGGCYPADALRLTNCSINKSKPQYVDDNEVSYSLELIRSKVSPAKLRQNDVELKLLDIGMCSACADNAAAFYVKMPNSRCATLVRQALEGEPTAIAKLNDMPDYCSE
jgi:hypothetical protein